MYVCVFCQSLLPSTHPSVQCVHSFHCASIRHCSQLAPPSSPIPILYTSPATQTAAALQTSKYLSILIWHYIFCKGPVLDNYLT